MTLVFQSFRVALPRRRIHLVSLKSVAKHRCGGGWKPRVSLQAPPISWFSTTTPPLPSDQSKHDTTTTSSSPIQEMVDVSTVGVGQVIFLNSKTSGQIILASLAIGDPLLVTMAMLGAVTSTATATYIPLPSKGTLSNGLYSYNGCLIGCASSVFLSSTFTTTSSLVLATTALTLTGATVATITTALLNKICPPMPQWTYAFNFVMLTALLRVQPFAPKGAMPPSEVTEVVDLMSTTTRSTLDIVLSPLTGLSQIFVVESAWTGVGILAAIASYSPGLAYHALMGSTIGGMVGTLVYNVPIADVTAGLWGYNSALTSLGVGVFFVPSHRTSALSIVGAMATSAVFGAMQPAFPLTPCLTLPFCITMSACWLLGTSASQQTAAVVPRLLLAQNPHSPEKNSI